VDKAAVGAAGGAAGGGAEVLGNGRSRLGGSVRESSSFKHWEEQADADSSSSSSMSSSDDEEEMVVEGGPRDGGREPQQQEIAEAPSGRVGLGDVVGLLRLVTFACRNF
jgi:hypothetical protein